MMASHTLITNPKVIFSINSRQSVPSLIGHFNNRRVANEVIRS